AMSLLEALEAKQVVQWRRCGAGAALTSAKKPITAFKIDWTAIERRRKADLQKLDAMQQYAYTKGCRRGFVLRYFGDPAARPSCAGCDNCLGTRVEFERGASAVRGSPKRKRKPEDRPAEEAPALSGADEALLARLRDLRRTISREDQVPAYV